MDVVSFFKPTTKKIILPAALFLFVLFGDLFGPVLCDCTLYDKLIMAVTNVSHVTTVVVILLVTYLISCFIFRKSKSKGVSGPPVTQITS
jgi:hypothetical protein